MKRDPEEIFSGPYRRVVGVYTRPRMPRRVLLMIAIVAAAVAAIAALFLGR